MTTYTDTFATRTATGNFGSASDGEAYSVITNNNHAAVGVGSNEGYAYYDGAGSGYGQYEVLLGSGIEWNTSQKFRVKIGSWTGGPEVRMIFRYKDSSNYAKIDIINGGMRYIKSVGGSSSTTTVASITTTANTFYWLKVDTSDFFIGVKWWQDGQAEPSNYTWSTTDTAIHFAGQFGLGVITTATTQANGIFFDNFTVNGLPASSPNTFYVSSTGSDSNPGTALLPFATLAKADTQVFPGCTVNVMPGTYNKAGGHVTSTSGTATNPITYQSLLPLQAKISSTGYAFIWTGNGSYVNYIGFEITDGGDNASRIGLLNYGSYCYIHGNYVHDIPCVGYASGGGIDNATYTAVDNVIDGNLVYNIAVANKVYPGQAHSIYNGSQGGSITNNICVNTSGWGLHNWHSAKNCTVSNNLVINGWSGGCVVGGAEGSTADFMTVTNNIFINCKNDGPIRETGSTGTNNIYFNNLVYVTSDFDASTMHYGGPYGYSLQNGNLAYKWLWSDPALYSSIPKETDPASFSDFTLRSSSPCIGAGAFNGLPSKDFTGNPFITQDIGPFAFSGKIYTSMAARTHVLMNSGSNITANGTVGNNLPNLSSQSNPSIALHFACGTPTGTSPSLTITVSVSGSGSQWYQVGQISGITTMSNNRLVINNIIEPLIKVDVSVSGTNPSFPVNAFSLFFN